MDWQGHTPGSAWCFDWIERPKKLPYTVGVIIIVIGRNVSFFVLLSLLLYKRCSAHTSSSSVQPLLYYYKSGGVICGEVQKERARVTSRPPRNMCCAQMPKNERLRFRKSHTTSVYTLLQHAHTANISLLLSPSQLEHSMYTPNASQPPQFGKHSRPTIYTTPSGLNHRRHLGHNR